MDAPETTWQPITIKSGYGGRTCELQIVSATAVWYHTGLPAVPIRWGLVRDPKGKLEPQAFLSMDIDPTAEQILLWFRQRWQVEVTFEEVRTHLGLETQRQWSDLAILRTSLYQRSWMRSLECVNVLGKLDFFHPLAQQPIW